VAYRRRRLAAVLVLVLAAPALQVAVHAAPAWLGGGSLATPESRPAAVAATASAVHVVQPGDTLWSLARRIQPTGDIRSLVDRLAAAQDGRPLTAGQRIVLP
jgi:hypothetical protein